MITKAERKEVWIDQIKTAIFAVRPFSPLCRSFKHRFAAGGVLWSVWQK